jgi:hypothetical protein
MTSAREKMQPQKRARGRPATGKGTPVQVRIQDPDLDALDRAIAERPGPHLTRPEFIRQIVLQWLKRRGFIG